LSAGIVLGLIERVSMPSSPQILTGFVICLIIVSSNPNLKKIFVGANGNKCKMHANIRGV